MYAAAADPWGFEDRWYEQRKYAISLAMLPAARYRSAFEPGCSIGVLTADARRRAATRCCPATSPPPRSAAAARRTAALPQVRVEQRELPGGWPAGRSTSSCSPRCSTTSADDDLEQVLDRGLARSSRRAPCSPCTGGIRSPTTRGPATTCTRRSRDCPGLGRLVRHTEPDFLAEVYIRTDGTPVSVAQARAWCEPAGPVRSRRPAWSSPAHDEEALLPACLAALRRAAARCACRSTCWWSPMRAATGRPRWPGPGEPAVISIQARSVGAARAAGIERAPAADVRLRSVRGLAGYHGRRHRGAAGMAAAPARIRERGLGCRPRHGHRHRLGRSPAARAGRVRGTLRLRSGPHPLMCTARISASGPPPTWPPGGFRPLRTAEDHALLAAATEAGCPVVQAGDITVETSAAGWRARPAASATCCGPWLTGGVPTAAPRRARCDLTRFVRPFTRLLGRTPKGCRQRTAG